MHIIISLLILASYLTSLVYCLTEAEWLAMIVLHVLLAPLGVIHGFFVWFGASWF